MMKDILIDIILGLTIINSLFFIYCAIRLNSREGE